MTLRNPPAGWCGDVGIDPFTPQTVRTLEHPVVCGLGGNGGDAAYVIGKLDVAVHLSAPIGNDMLGNQVRRRTLRRCRVAPDRHLPKFSIEERWCYSPISSSAPTSSPFISDIRSAA